ncbi:Golgi SNAP receptor complex member 1 [Thoreauomyces humboldtii]|nr:Golgi SNAP receptor complex member 1 [Thoreauomyces humboldtii]
MAFRGAAGYSAVPDTIISIPSDSNPKQTYDGSPAPAAATASAATWETLRKQARQLENETEAKLVQYSKLGTGAGGGAGGSGSGGGPSGYGRGASPTFDHASTASANGAELELEHLLAKLTSVVNYMAQSLDTSAPTNPSMMHMLQRHRDILYDYTKEFKKTKGNLKAARDHAELLGSVRDDISMYKSGMNQQDLLLDERGRIDGSHRMADEVLQAAYSTRHELNEQRGVLYGAQGRVTGVLARFPLVNDLVSRINTRKQRDSLIMAGVISVCVCLLLWYMLR